MTLKMKFFTFLLGTWAVLLAAGCSSQPDKAQTARGDVKSKSADVVGDVVDEVVVPATSGQSLTFVETSGLAMPPVDLEAIERQLVDREEDGAGQGGGQVMKVSPPDSNRLSLTHLVDRVWGVRLPVCSPGVALESRIGAPPFTIELDENLLAPDLPRFFPREIVIVLSRKEVIVNEFKVADVVYMGSDDQDGREVTPQGDSGDSQPQGFYLSKAQGSLVIDSLTAQIEQLTRYRATLLRVLGVNSDLASVSDLATLVVDEALPYRILAEVIHSAAMADIYRFRIAAKSSDEVISYIVVSSPRLDQEGLGRVHILGDDWWEKSEVQERDFEYAYLSYIASLSPDSWKGECGQELPEVIPGEISSWNFLNKQKSVHRLEENLKWVQATQRRSGCPDMDAVEPAVQEPGPEVPPPAPEVVAAAPAEVPEAEAPGAEVPEENPEEEIIPAGAIVLTPPIKPLVMPFIYLTGEGCYLVYLDMNSGTVIRSEFYKDIQPLVESLDSSSNGGGVIHLGAEPEVSTGKLVEAADMVRTRCVLRSMSGRCMERENWFGTVYLFTSPDGRFRPMPVPSPQAVPEPTAAPEAGGEEPVAEGEMDKEEGPGEPLEPGSAYCPLKEIKPLAEGMLSAILDCVKADVEGVDALNLNVTWHDDGRLELKSVSPPLRGDVVRCIKAVFLPVDAARRDTCDCTLIISHESLSLVAGAQKRQVPGDNDAKKADKGN